MGNLLGENLDPFVLKQMRTRQLIHGSGVDSSRDPIKIKALNSSTSFIRLASAVNVDEAKLSSLGIDPTTNVGDGLARNNILFNGTSKLNATFSEEGFGNSSNPSEDVLAGLSNEYADYTTTFEEYQAQRYEGASTAYGPNELEGFISQFKRLVNDMSKGVASKTLAAPPTYLDKQISLQPGKL